MSKRPRKLDLQAVLAAIDRHDLGWLDRQPQAARRELALPVLLRWASTIGGDGVAAEYMLQAVNQRLNQAGWGLAAYPDLAFRLAASCGPGLRLDHRWLAMPRASPAPESLYRLLADRYPLAKTADLDLLLDLYDHAEFVALARDSGLPEAAVKELGDAFSAYLG